MKVRGNRECRDCGTRWSYFETGAVACPECGSMRSSGVGDRALHTNSPAELDLRPAIDLLDAGNLDDALAETTDTCREYLGSRGFIHEGDLQPLDEQYLVAQELRHAATLARSRLRLDEAEEAYLRRLLEAASAGEAPPDLPDSFRTARGLGTAAAIRDYLDDVGTVVDESETVATYTSVVGTIRDHVKRIKALDGEVDPAETAALVEAVRAIGRYGRTGDQTAIEDAKTALDRLR